MATVREMEMLLGSMDDAGRSFRANRVMRQSSDENALDRAMRQRMHGEDLGLRREELGARREESALDRAMRGEDMADARANRNLALENQQKYQQAMIAAKTEDDKFQVLVQMAKEGALTDEGIAKMSEAFNAKLGQAGIGAKLFKLPTSTETSPQPWTHPKTGKEFATYGKTILPADEPFADVTEETDDMGTTTRKVTRKVRAADLDKPKAAAAPAAGGDRVTVISPDGKRGTIPRAQLDEALRKGFKQAQ